MLQVIIFMLDIYRDFFLLQVTEVLYILSAFTFLSCFYVFFKIQDVMRWQNAYGGWCKYLKCESK